MPAGEDPESKTGVKDIDDAVNTQRANQLRGYDQATAELQRNRRTSQGRRREKVAFAAAARLGPGEYGFTGCYQGHFAKPMPPGHGSTI